MADVPANTPLFNFDQIRIDIQDLVRTGFQEKYNELAKAVITDITWKFEEVGTSGSTQVLIFHTANLGIIEIPIFGGGGGIIEGLCAEDICYDDAQGRYDNVQQALDSLLNPYAPPTGSTTGGAGLKEVGDTSFYPVKIKTTGYRHSVDLDYVKFTESSNLGAHTYTNSNISSGSNGEVTNSYTLISTPHLNPNSPIYYSWTGRVKDKETGERSAGSTWMRYVYPYYKFNNSNQVLDRGQLESLINTGSIHGILDNHYNGPSQITLDAASSSQYMHILVPAAFDSVSEIIDANLGLGSAPGWDTDLSSPNTEFYRTDITLTKTEPYNNGPHWTDINYRVYVSKIQKSNLTLIFKL